GFGLLTFCEAQIRPGFEVVAGCLDLETAIAGADLMVTAEGSLDSQTLEGKAPLGVAKLARKHRKRVVAIAGHISPDVDWSGVFDAALPLSEQPLALEESVRNAANLLEQSAQRIAKLNLL
ncbi:MAG TPA: glycerate kinase, partial [Chthoniobacteraceae bacterium]|nr:glycerate kinase [Chthoniobacteraceae bacterium]